MLSIVGIQLVIRGGWLLLKYITLENHPADSRVKILDDDICQTLSSRMGTGGGNVPMVIEVDDAEDSDNTE
jgi:hypothetical protein